MENKRIWEPLTQQIFDAKLNFTVYGRPQQRGSKRAMVIYRNGKPVMANGRVCTYAMDANKNSGQWMAEVRAMAAAAYGGKPLLAGPIILGCKFFFARPKSHYGANGLKASAPRLHLQTPDLAKLIRALEDAITGQVWRDDKQVWCYAGYTGKYWTEAAERVEVTIYAQD
jgi:Holliday junction resolvase RusA-like endonuclease